MTGNRRSKAVLIRFTEPEDRLLLLAARAMNFSRARLIRWAALRAATQVFDEKKNWPANTVIFLPQLLPIRTTTGKLAELLAPDNGPVDDVEDEHEDEAPPQRGTNPGRLGQARAHRANRQRAENKHRNEKP